MITELKGVDQCRTVLDLAVEPDDRGLAVRLGGRLQRLQHLGSQKCADIGGSRFDALRQVFDETLSDPRVLDDSSDNCDAGGGTDLSAALGPDLLGAGDNFAQRYQRILSKLCDVTAGSVVRSPMRGCGRGPVDPAATITISSARGASYTRVVTVW